jgi:hypothetical protein
MQEFPAQEGAFGEEYGQQTLEYGGPAPVMDAEFAAPNEGAVAFAEAVPEPQADYVPQATTDFAAGF